MEPFILMLNEFELAGDMKLLLGSTIFLIIFHLFCVACVVVLGCVLGSYDRCAMLIMLVAFVDGDD